MIIPKKSGIYLLTNNINNKMYVGQTFNFIDRQYKYKSMAKCNSKNKYSVIEKAIRKYGWSNFRMTILEIVDITNKNSNSKQILINKETEWKIKLNTLIPNGYNMLLIDNNLYEFAHSKEANIKQSKSQKERFKNKENHPMYGKKHTKESKEKMSIALKGKMVGIKNPRYGNHSNENYKHLGKPVKQIDPKTNEIIKIWSSMRSASTGLSGHSKFDYKIAQVCTGKLDYKGNIRRKTTLGFKWEFVN